MIINWANCIRQASFCPQCGECLALSRGAICELEAPPTDTDLGVVSYFRRGFLNRLSAPFIRAYCLLYGTGQ